MFRVCFPTLPRILRTLLPATLLAAHAIGFAQGPAMPAMPAPPQNVLNLSASATAEVTMDLLAITFSTLREGPDAATVQAQLKQALDAALIEARKVARPGQVDVRTGNFSLQPRYGQKGAVTGWQGTAQLQVEGSDMAAITQLAGRIQTLSIANVRHGLSRETREKVEAETTAQAIARFRERAQAQAQLFGFTGFAIREVSVGSEGSQPPMPVMAMRAQVAMSAEAPLPVEAGRTTVSSNVSGSVQMLK
jgi:predicted secreted protein